MDHKFILHVIGHLEKGGAEQQLRYLIKNSHPRIKHIVLCLDGKVSNDELLDKIKVFELERRYKLDVFSLGLEIHHFIKKYSPDLLHLWLPEILTVPAAISGKLLGIPILSAHRRSPENFIDLKQWFRDRARYLAHLLSDKLVVNFKLSSRGSSFFNWIFERRTGRFIPNSVDFKKLQGFEKKALRKIQSDHFKLIFAGRLTSQKRIDNLIQCLFELEKVEENITLDIFGEGEMYQDLQSQIDQYSINDIVKMHGYRSDWLSFAKSADLFVLPSISEGMSNVLMEAAAINLPILAMDIPENRQIFEHGKDIFLVEKQDKIKPAISYLKSNTALRKKLAKNARNKIEEFSIAKMVQCYEDIYKDLYQV